MWGVNPQDVTSRALRVRIARIAEEYAHGFCDSILRGHGVDFLGVRPFEAGDSPRRVDWKASSRADDDTELIVRVFTPERKPTVIVVADLGHAMEHPKAKTLYAHALVEMYARSAFTLGGVSRIIGIGKEGIIASNELTSGDEVLLFMRQCDNPRMRRQFRQPWKSLKHLFAEWKPKNTLIVFVSDLRPNATIDLDALNAVDGIRQNVECTYVVLDEWSGFVPTAHVATLENAETGGVALFDLREGGEFHQESLQFEGRLASLRILGRRKGMSVHALPLTRDRPLAEFLRSWNKFQASRS